MYKSGLPSTFLLLFQFHLIGISKTIKLNISVCLVVRGCIKLFHNLHPIVTSALWMFLLLYFNVSTSQKLVKTALYRMKSTWIIHCV